MFSFDLLVYLQIKHKQAIISRRFLFKWTFSRRIDLNWNCFNFCSAFLIFWLFWLDKLQRVLYLRIGLNASFDKRKISVRAFLCFEVEGDLTSLS